MELTRVWRRAFAAVRTGAAIVAAVACIAGTLAPALAGTTGVVHGTVTNGGGAPLADVAVTLTAPSGTYHSTTDVKGFYAIAGIYPDTYTASFVKAGFDTSEVTGVTVFADQSITVSTKLTKSLKTIAKVTARSAASAFQPEQTTDTYTVNSQQIDNLQGSSLNTSESNLITSLPGVGYDSSGYPVIHGGRENEEGFEFEGIPYTDAYTNQFVNTLALPGSGIASAQLTPGVGDASVQSNGTGVINLVAKRGTYPGNASSEVRVGGPGFDHALNADLSFASPNGTWSNYTAFAGSNTAYRIGDGNYPANVIGAYTSRRLSSNREFLENLVYRFGKNHNQAVQLFADVASHLLYQGYGGLNGFCFESCNPYFTSFWGGSIYGLSNSQIQAISPLYPFQPAATTTLASVNRAQQTYHQPNEAYKLGYTLNINPSTYLTADVYSVNAVTTFDIPTGSTNSLGLGDAYIQQGGHSIGGEIKLQKQLNEKNLLEIGYDYAWRHGIDSYHSLSYGFYGYLIQPGAASGAPYDFVNPNDPNCPVGPGNCGYAYGAFPGAAQLTMPIFDQISELNRRDQSFYINDKLTLNDHLNVSLGLRDEKADFVGLPTPKLNADCTFQYNPASVTNAPAGSPCPFIPNFSNITNDKIHPNELEPRLGIAWQLNDTTALRFTYDRSTTFPFLSFVDLSVGQGQFTPYNKLAAAPGAVCGQVLYPVNCSSYGQELYWAQQNFNGPQFQPILPMTSSDYSLTLQHQFTKGFLNGVAFSIAPWVRHQYNTEASVSQPLLGANGQPQFQNGQILLGPATVTNLGKEFGDGVDVNITRESATGLSGQWTMSYVNEFSSVIPTSSNEDFFPSIPYASALAGNEYRVGFLSPFQTTLGLTYRTKNGWRINPRISYNIGYPIGNGTLTSLLYNNKGVNIPNTDVVPAGSASQSGLGPTYYVDPLNPGTIFNPNVIAQLGNDVTPSAGGKLTKPNVFANITLEYAPANKPFKIGLDVENVFNKVYDQNGVFLNPRYQPVATGIGGPLTGYSTHKLDYSLPYANPQYLSAFGGNGLFVNFPNAYGRRFYLYYSVKL